MKRPILSSFFVAGLIATPALADPIGTATQVTGDPGTVLAIRDGQSVTLQAGSALSAGDRVIVRGNGTAELNAFTCSKSLKAPAMAVLSDGFCNDTVISLKDSAQAAPPTRSASAGARSIPRRVTGAVGAGAGVAGLAVLRGSTGGSESSSAILGATDGGTAENGTPGTSAGPGPTTDSPISGNDGTAFDAGSGLDPGLFGFFEATSS